MTKRIGPMTMDDKTAEIVHRNTRTVAAAFKDAPLSPLFAQNIVRNLVPMKVDARLLEAVAYDLLERINWNPFDNLGLSNEQLRMAANAAAALFQQYQPLERKQA